MNAGETHAIVAHASLCNSTHNITVLSAFTCSISVMLCFTTAPFNFVLIMAILGDNMKILKKSIFYKLILNIAIADLLIGSFADITSISFHFKEAMRFKMYTHDVILVHFGLFVLSNVSILSMALLCIDRIFALMKPIAYYRNALTNRMCLMVLVSIWVISALLVWPYFFVGYITYLGIFAFTSVTITCISLVLVVYLYKTKFSIYNNFNKSCSLGNETLERNAQSDSTNKLDASKLSKSNIKESCKLENINTVKKPDFKPNSAEQRVNQSFIIMLVVFLLTYMPACCTIIYMNFCTACNCTLIQVLRDYAYLSLLSGSLWRCLNFAYRITTLNKKLRQILTFRQKK